MQLKNVFVVISLSFLLFAFPIDGKTPHFAKKPVKTVSDQNARRTTVIVIDPGHGGKDPGAIGPHGAREKDVVLAVSRDLYTLLKNEDSIYPVLTRKGDYFIPLRGRLRIARKRKADLFIAIHADAYKERDARGASVFALSKRGATSEAARWLAQRENYSELGGVGLEDKNYMLRSVLLDLSQTETIKSSLLWGQSIVDSIGHTTLLHCRHVEQAPFVVLKSPDIPSLLVEIGFISSRSEEALLRAPAYQQKIAMALFDGIMQYLHNK